MRTVKTDDSHAQGIPGLVRGAYVNVRSVVAAEATESLELERLGGETPSRQSLRERVSAASASSPLRRLAIRESPAVL